MRHVWIALAVVLADLLSGLPAVYGLPETGIVIPVGALRVGLFGTEGMALYGAHPAALNVATGMALLVPLAAVMSLLLLARPLLMSFTLVGIGAQLLAGAVLSEAFVYLIYGATAPLLERAVAMPPLLHLAVRHVAMFAGGIVLLVAYGQRRAARSVARPPLAAAPPPVFDLSGLLRGNDNVHIDVALSADFMTSAQRAIAHLIAQQLVRTANTGPQEAPAPQLLRQFQESYAGMLRVAVSEAGAAGETRRIELLQLAVLGYVRARIRTLIVEAIEQHHQRDRSAYRRRAGAPVRPDQTERLLAARAGVFHQVCRQVFTLLGGQEQRILARRREALAGMTLTSLFNVPLLQAASPEDDDVLMEHYVLLGHRGDDRHNFRRLDELFNQTFPLPAIPDATAAEQVLPPSVLTAPGGIARLFDAPTTRVALRAARHHGRPEQVAELRTQLRSQRWQLARLHLAMERAGLVPTVLAVYETPRLHAHYAGTFGPQLLNDLISAPHGLWHMRRRLRMLSRRAADRAALRPILQAARRVRQRSSSDVSAELVRFARDFSAYRHDLQLYLAVQNAISEIRLLDDANELATARLNRRLYEFPVPAELASDAGAVAGHVILKADVRGSTHITEELVRRKLNPATYFGRNFYDPITTLTQHFQGEKVFIEGDAIILQFIEPADARFERLAVARACALAARLLEVVAQNNERNAVYGLPPLEMGVGITYEPASPTYVFDGATRIVISPAINRADRLSSCARGLQRRLRPHEQLLRVVVFAAPDDGDDPAGKPPADLIYNVNGIALEAAAFERLGEELTLHAVLDAPQGLEDGELFAVHWPQPQGKRRRLVIRRARVRAATETMPATAPEAAYYHEVIADPALLDVLEEARLSELGASPDTPRLQSRR